MDCPALRRTGRAAFAAAVDLAARVAAGLRALYVAAAAAFFLRWGDPFGWGAQAFPARTRGFRSCAVEGFGDPRSRGVAAFVYRFLEAPTAADWRWAAGLAGAPPLAHVLHFWGAEGSASLFVDPQAGAVRLLRGLDAAGAGEYPPASAGTVYIPSLLLGPACLAAGAAPAPRRRPAPSCRAAPAPLLRSNIPDGNGSAPGGGGGPAAETASTLHGALPRPTLGRRRPAPSGAFAAEEARPVPGAPPLEGPAARSPVLDAPQSRADQSPDFSTPRSRADQSPGFGTPRSRADQSPDFGTPRALDTPQSLDFGTPQGGGAQSPATSRAVSRASSAFSAPRARGSPTPSESSEIDTDPATAGLTFSLPGRG